MKMPSFSYISITQKPLSLKPLLLKAPKASITHKLLFPTPRRASQYLLSLLLFWVILHVSLPLLPPPLACSGYLHRLHRRDQFWRWVQADVPKAQPCLHFSRPYRNSSEGIHTGKYMMAVVSGGLNQQRNQIVDAVVIARIIGAVLVVPVLKVNQVWGDESEFIDIFDVKHFKDTLRDHVVVVSSLPATHLRRRRVGAPTMPFKAGEDWVRTHYRPKLDQETVFILRGFDSRLAKDLSDDLQKLRCKVAFEALRFQPWIQDMAERLVERMEEDGPYMALHLRLEKDVWVRTGCHSGLGKEADLQIERERASKPEWLTSRSKLTPQQRYQAGLCPLNAADISRMLKGLGASYNTRIYWAGGDPFGGKKALEPLHSQFPKLFNKWNLTRPGELDDIKRKPSVLAALDYAVCLKSQVFMASHGGNMARSLQGHRTYMGYGKYIKPNKKLLVQLFMNSSLTEDEMGEKIKQIHTSSNSSSLEKIYLKRDVIANPFLHCMCSNKTEFKSEKKA